MSKPKGKLKIAAPACLGRRYVAPALCEFVRAYPEIDVQVDLHDRQVNLQEDGYDIAIRTGALSDSSLIAKRLAPDRHVDRCLARLSGPQRPPAACPRISPRHDCLVLGEGRQWSFGKDGVEARVRVDGPLRSNNGELLCHAAVEGLGLIRASELEVLCELRSGKLVQVLSDCEVATNSACGPSIRAPSTCCRACARCWISSPTGSATRATATRAPATSLAIAEGMRRRGARESATWRWQSRVGCSAEPRRLRPSTSAGWSRGRRGPWRRSPRA